MKEKMFEMYDPFGHKPSNDIYFRTKDNRPPERNDNFWKLAISPIHSPPAMDAKLIQPIPSDAMEPCHKPSAMDETKPVSFPEGIRANKSTCFAMPVRKNKDQSVLHLLLLL
ncbi:hypothetical protein AVEN_88477-1 [Araneus ventricosus]|uniref:Uncharacterized protein n=1 Tax=Araneus ventricosus TaxID=182803 RepID=A0A4Y2TRE7_ARAVE|nr:hypothetical protein AVEN_88477-1 [Araneus ventricosus]